MVEEVQAAEMWLAAESSPSLSWWRWWCVMEQFACWTPATLTAGWVGSRADS